MLALLLLVLISCLTLSQGRDCGKRTVPSEIEGEYDFIVVGAGSGAVVASRLSEKFHVLLLESGQRVYDQPDVNKELLDSILVGNGLPFAVGDLEVDGKIVGKVNHFGQILDESGAEIGKFTRPIPLHSEGGIFLNGEDISEKAKLVNQEPNPYALPDGSAFGLHIQKTPFMVPYLSMTNASHFYNLVPQIFSQKREITYPRGRIVGGSTATNWMVFFKGTRHDFDQIWRDEHGLEGWGYDDLAPYFVKFENNTHIQGSPKHGYEGPIKTTISANFLEDFEPINSWHEAALKLGWQNIEDSNDPENQYGSSKTWQQFVSDTGRRSDSSDYIRLADQQGRVCWDTPKSECEPHQTLHIWTEKHVTKILIDEKTLRATGVEFVSSEFVYEARSAHPDYPDSADEGLKHRTAFNKFDPESTQKTDLGAPVAKHRANNLKNLNDQYIRKPQDLTGHLQRVTAKREVILAAGAVGTAQVLLLSGIGPKDDLRARGIKTLVDLPVGQRVQDHQEVVVHYKFPEGYEPHFDFLKEAPTFPSVVNWIQGKKSFLSSNHALGGLEGSSRGPASDDKVPTYHLHHVVFGTLESVDFNLAISNEAIEPPYRLPRNVAEFFGFKGTLVHTHLCELSGNHAYGKIELRSECPLAQPFVDLRWGSSKEDNIELTACIREVRKIMANSKPEHAGTEFGPCAEAHTDEEIELCIRNSVWGHHIASSAPMGTCNSKYAVTDSHARVFGVEGLRIVDISIFPEVPHGNPTGVLFAVAEKLSDMIAEDYKFVTQRDEL